MRNVFDTSGWGYVGPLTSLHINALELLPVWLVRDSSLHILPGSKTGTTIEQSQKAAAWGTHTLTLH